MSSRAVWVGRVRQRFPLSIRGDGCRRLGHENLRSFDASDIYEGGSHSRSWRQIRLRYATDSAESLDAATALLPSVSAASTGRERIVSVVLAAGAGRRFGGRKQLALLRGRPLLEHALVTAAAGPAEERVVVLGAYAEDVARGIDLAGVRVVNCREWSRGRGASLRTGLAALGPEVGAALVTLGDEPFVPAEASWRLLAARRPGVAALRATYKERPGHPVLIERQLFALFAAAGPDVRPAKLLDAAGINAIECGDLADPEDVDTPAQMDRIERLLAAKIGPSGPIKR